LAGNTTPSKKMSFGKLPSDLVSRGAYNQ